MSKKDITKAVDELWNNSTCGQFVESTAEQRWSEVVVA